MFTKQAVIQVGLIYILIPARKLLSIIIMLYSWTYICGSFPTKPSMTGMGKVQKFALRISSNYGNISGLAGLPSLESRWKKLFWHIRWTCSFHLLSSYKIFQAKMLKYIIDTGPPTQQSTRSSYNYTNSPFSLQYIASTQDLLPEDIRSSRTLKLSYNH